MAEIKATICELQTHDRGVTPFSNAKALTDGHEWLDQKRLSMMKAPLECIRDHFITIAEKLGCRPQVAGCMASNVRIGRYDGVNSALRWPQMGASVSKLGVTMHHGTVLPKRMLTRPKKATPRLCSLLGEMTWSWEQREPKNVRNLSLRKCAQFAAAALILGGVFSSAFSASSGAAGPDSAGAITNGPMVKHVALTVNKSRTFTVEKPFSRAIVGAVDYADVLPMSDRVIYVQGKKIGTTNVSLFDAQAQLIGVIDLDITPDTNNLEERIRASTQSTRIHVSSNQGQIILSGVAADAVAADHAVQLAKSLSGDVPVVNAMEVAPTQQVMLEVRFLEVSRTAARALGVNWFGLNGNNFQANTGLGAVNNPNASSSGAPTQVLPLISTLGTFAGSLASTGPFGVLLANVARSGSASLDVLLTALEQKGLVRSLAEPNLIALSGDQADFLAGGEYPVPVAQGGATAGAITVEYKKFGVQLIFRPTVLRSGVINLVVDPSVSQIDPTISVSICTGCSPVPGLTTREAHTVIELRDGQSFAIAGLLQHVNTGDMSQLPWLGSVPVLGTLFRSSSYQQHETDLVVIVTPHLISPAVPGQRMASPLDSRLPSNDVDFFLNGQPEVKKRYEEFVSSGGGLNGPYGYMIPVEHDSTKK